MENCALDRECRRTVGKLVDWAVVAGVSCRLTLVWDNFFGEIVRVFVCQSPYPTASRKAPTVGFGSGLIVRPTLSAMWLVALWRHDPS